jgi:uncharacterized protein YaaW (UPF0174 family)
MNITRRNAVIVATGSALAIGAYGWRRSISAASGPKKHYLYPYVNAALFWKNTDFDTFLRRLKVPEQDVLLKSLGWAEKQPYNPDRIKKEVRYVASNIATYPFREKLDYDYHIEIVSWVAKQYGVNRALVESKSTFYLEHMILCALFTELWDKLTPKQRTELLSRIEQQDKIKDKAGLALAGGAVALAALSTTVYFAGSAFYLTMSTVIYSAAGFFGATIPFSAYMASSSTVATLSGPVGWAIFGIAATGAVLFLGRADRMKSAAFVTQLHMIKVMALNESGMLDKTMAHLKMGPIA